MNFKRYTKPETSAVRQSAPIVHGGVPFDVNTIEDDINALVTQDYAPPFDERKRPEPPTVEDIGLVTADAVMAQYEAAAKTIEAMREPMTEWTSKCQLMLADLKAAMDYIDDTARRFREIGASTHERIQKASTAITEVRATCDAIRTKINGDVPDAK